MMTDHEMLMAEHPIRRTKAQKEAFRAWAILRAEQAGWQARVEKTARGDHHNVVIGDPERAEVVFTAHYDTPAVMFIPNLMLPRNIPLYVLYMAGTIGLLAVAGSLGALAAARLTHSEIATRLAFFVIYFGLLALMLYGPANKHNANDNSSGVAAALSIMAAIPAAHRHKAAFILFDDEEKGLLGSKGYAKDHPEVKDARLVVNLDCVGVGEHALVIAKDGAKKQPGYALMAQCLRETAGLAPHFFDAKSSVGSSDHKNFRCGVAVFTCKRKRVVGFYTPAIHTPRDTECRPENLAYLTTAMGKFVEKLAE